MWWSLILSLNYIIYFRGVLGLLFLSFFLGFEVSQISFGFVGVMFVGIKSIELENFINIINIRVLEKRLVNIDENVLEWRFVNVYFLKFGVVLFNMVVFSNLDYIYII